MIRSLLRYPGGKAKAMPFLLEHMPDGIEDWREPFFGGGSVTIGFLQSPKSKDCKKFVVGDLYKGVYGFWKGLQTDPEAMIAETYEFMRTYMPTQAEGARLYMETGGKTDDAVVAKAIAEGKAFWDWSRTVDKDSLTLAQQAARFFIINRTSFSGMSDAGSMTNDQLFKFKPSDVEKARELSKLLQPVEILNASFEVTMDGVDDERGFIFLDPPYFQQSADGTGGGMYGGVGAESTHNGFPHEKLRDLLLQTKCRWLMTYDDSIAVRKWYNAPGIDLKEFKLTYTMAGNTAVDALAGEELLISNYLAKQEEDDDEVEEW